MAQTSEIWSSEQFLAASLEEESQGKEGGGLWYLQLALPFTFTQTPSFWQGFGSHGSGRWGSWSWTSSMSWAALFCLSRTRPSVRADCTGTTGTSVLLRWIISLKKGERHQNKWVILYVVCLTSGAHRVLCGPEGASCPFSLYRALALPQQVLCI